MAISSTGWRRANPATKEPRTAAGSDRKSKSKVKAQKSKGKSAGRTAMRQVRFGFQHRKKPVKRQSRSLLRFDFCVLTFDLLFCLLSLLSVRCFAQAPPSEPYAAIIRAAVSYNGPGRDAGHDLAGAEIRLGLLAPLAGPRQAEGEALRRAAEMAIEEENATSPPGGRRLALVTRDESGPWGQASAQIV